MSRPWMPLHVGDRLRDTRDLNTLQHGAYLLLIMHCCTASEWSREDRDAPFARRGATLASDPPRVDASGAPPHDPSNPKNGG